jgi:hypothetical protein
MASIQVTDSLKVARTDCLPSRSAAQVWGNNVSFLLSFKLFSIIYPIPAIYLKK